LQNLYFFLAKFLPFNKTFIFFWLNFYLLIKPYLFSTRLLKLKWCNHFALGTISTFVLMCQSHLSQLIHKKLSLHSGYPHYVWWQKIDSITIRLVTKFSIVLSLNWVTKKFWSPQLIEHFFSICSKTIWELS